MTFLEAARQFRIQLGSMLILLAILYWRIIPPMVQQWYQDENYSHGFIVPFITAYFIYVRWDELRQAPVSPSKFGFAFIFLGLCQLLIGWLGVEYFLMRSSLIVLLAGLLVYFFGIAALRIVAVPLAYLIFMVPIPYIVYDAVAFPLKLFVTKISVGFLKILGVAVVREGNIIMFPATTLEVADACSGIRSLISLFAIAAAYAFFIKISSTKRWILILSALPIAISTNAIRVIVTGLLAQYWGARAAEGFFHEFAGLAVFAIAIIILISVGTLLGREKSQFDQKAHNNNEGFPDNLKSYNGPHKASYISILILFISTALYINLHSDIFVPSKKSFNLFPGAISGWRMTGEYTMPESVQKVLKASETLSRQYVSSDSNQVSLYIGYHGGGKGSGGIHSPKHCLPGSGWHEISTARRVLDVGGTKLNLVQAVYQNGDNKELFLYWFQARDKTMNEELSVKVAEITNSMLYRRRDTSFIRISIPIKTDEHAAQVLGERFIRDFYPSIQDFLPDSVSV